MTNKITDRELLAFCSLAKLKLEFSQYKIYREKTKLWEYKTPRQLIDLEIEGQKNRLELIANKNIELQERRKELSREKYEIEKEMAGIKELIKLMEENPMKIFKYSRQECEDLIRKNDKKSDEHKKKVLEYDIAEKENKDFQKTALEEGKLGMFYRIHKNGNVKFYYENSDDLRLDAPMLMEYYDTYDAGNPDSKFLDEWEIVYTGDDYNLSVELYKNFLSNSVNRGQISEIKTEEDDIEHDEYEQEEEEKGIDESLVNKEIESIPHRDDIESSKLKAKKKRILTSAADLAINAILTFAVPAIAKKVTSKINKYKNPNRAEMLKQKAAGKVQSNENYIRTKAKEEMKDMVILVKENGDEVSGNAVDIYRYIKKMKTPLTEEMLEKLIPLNGLKGIKIFNGNKYREIAIDLKNMDPKTLKKIKEALLYMGKKAPLKGAGTQGYNLAISQSEKVAERVISILEKRIESGVDTALLYILGPTEVFITSESISTDLSKKDITQNFISNIVEGKDESADELLELMKKMPREMEFSFRTNGLKVLLLRKGNDEVLIIENKKELDNIERQFLQGEYPGAIAFFSQFFKLGYLKENNYLTISGVGVAGKIAAAIGLAREQEKTIVRGFYERKPISLSRIPFFNHIDINNSRGNRAKNTVGEYFGFYDEDSSPVANFFAVATYIVTVTSFIIGGPINIISALQILKVLILPVLENIMLHSQNKRILNRLIELGFINNKISDYYNLYLYSFSEIIKIDKSQEDLIIGKVTEKWKDPSFPFEYSGKKYNLNLESYLQLDYYLNVEKFVVYDVMEHEVPGEISILLDKITIGNSTTSPEAPPANKIIKLRISEDSNKKQILVIEKYIRVLYYFKEDDENINSSLGIKYGVMNGVAYYTESTIDDRVNFYFNIKKENTKDTDTIGEKLQLLLMLFYNIQKNYDVFKFKGYYLEEGIPQKIESLKDYQKLALEEEIRKDKAYSYNLNPIIFCRRVSTEVLKEMLKIGYENSEITPHESYYFFVDDNGNVSSEINKKILGAILQSMYRI